MATTINSILNALNKQMGGIWFDVNSIHSTDKARRSRGSFTDNATQTTHAFVLTQQKGGVFTVDVEGVHQFSVRTAKDAAGLTPELSSLIAMKVIRDVVSQFLNADAGVAKELAENKEDTFSIALDDAALMESVASAFKGDPTTCRRHALMAAVDDWQFSLPGCDVKVMLAEPEDTPVAIVTRRVAFTVADLDQVSEEEKEGYSPPAKRKLHRVKRKHLETDTPFLKAIMRSAVYETFQESGECKTFDLRMVMAAVGLKLTKAAYKELRTTPTEFLDFAFLHNGKLIAGDFDLEGDTLKHSLYVGMDSVWTSSAANTLNVIRARHLKNPRLRDAIYNALEHHIEEHVERDLGCCAQFDLNDVLASRGFCLTSKAKSLLGNSTFPGNAFMYGEAFTYTYHIHAADALGALTVAVLDSFTPAMSVTIKHDKVDKDPNRIMMELDYGRAAMKKFRKKGVSENFRIYAAGWNKDRTVLDVTGAEFKYTDAGILDEMVHGTSQTVYLSREELQAEAKAGKDGKNG